MSSSWYFPDERGSPYNVGHTHSDKNYLCTIIGMCCPVQNIDDIGIPKSIYYNIHYAYWLVHIDWAYWHDIPFFINVSSHWLKNLYTSEYILPIYPI